MKYDIIIVGAGLYGATVAWSARQKGMKCLVIDRRNKAGGNCRDECQKGINVHCYGPHIFHTNDKRVWEFVCQFAEFNHFRNMPMAHYRGKMYNLPFNMNTFATVFGANTPREARECLQKEFEMEYYEHPKNLEEKAISLVGKTIYMTLIKGYTEKQWGCDARDLPPEIIQRLPLRFNYDNNYFSDRWQGIPVQGYSEMIGNMLKDTDTLFNADFNLDREYWLKQASSIVYTGSVDELHDYSLGTLAYRSLRFEHEWHDCDNVQGCAVINETDRNIPYTRTIEHKHFAFGAQPVSIITKEFPTEWTMSTERFYPICNVDNISLYKEYVELTREKYKKVKLGGRLGLYKYINMDECIAHVMNSY